MSKDQIQKRIDKNREKINDILSKDVDLEILYMIVRQLAEQNERLIQMINAKA